MPQKIFVIEVDARNHGNPGSQNIRRIESSAQANFEDTEIHASLRKILKRHGCHALKVGGMCAKLSGSEELLDLRLNVRERLRKIGIVDFRAVHANAFIDPFQVRRSVQASTKTGLPQNRFQKRTCQPLAVSPANFPPRIPPLPPPPASPP